MTPILHIHLLGEFLLISGDTPVTTIDWPRLQSLLAYLLLHRNAPQSRTHLAFLLWPDSTEEQAHTNLRHLVYRLRRALPNVNSYLHANKQTLHWYPDVPWTLDVADFERAIADADQAERSGDQAAMRLAVEEAVKLYRGDLLPGAYEEWLLPERERLRQQFLDVLERLVLLLEKERQYQDAIRLAQRLLRHDPLHEATYRHLMRLYAGSGDRATALRTYHTCVTVLERELAMEPTPPTQEAYQRLLQKDTSSIPPAIPATVLVGVAPLVGRQPEWVQLQDTWQRTLAGQQGMVVLSGEAGIGKTRLAEEFLAWVDRQGIVTASASCYPAEGALAYAPLATWLRSDTIKPALAALADTWLTEVARFVPEVLGERPDLPHPGPLLEGWQRQRLFEALARAILGVRQPLLLLLEDLQWCDRETLEWLHYLLRFDSPARVLVIGTVRPEEVATAHPLESLLKTLRSGRHVAEILLLPLNAAETASLAAHIAGRDLDEQMAADLYRDTEGNPLFIVETLRMSGGKSKRMARGDRVALPSRIQAVIAARLAHLSPLGHELASLAAVLGRAFTFQVLTQASPLDEDALVLGLDELWQRRIIREQGAEAYDFSHDKLREVAYAALSTAHRRLLHRRAADALEVVYADRLDEVSGLMAAHYEQAGLIERAVPCYQRAAEVARRLYANAEAILSYQRVLALLNVTSHGQPQQKPWGETILHVYESLGDVLALTVQLEEARKAYQEALARVPMSECIREAHLQRKYAQTWKTQRRFEEALQAYRRAEAALEGEGVERTTEWWHAWIEIQSDRIEIYYWLAQLQEMTDLVEKTRPAVERDGTDAQRAAFFERLLMMSVRRDRYMVSEETLGYARLSLAARLALESETALAWARFSLGFSYLLHGDLDLAEEQLQAVQVMSERTGDVTLQSRNVTYLAVLSRKRGQVEETRRFGTQALALATALQLPEYMAMAKGNLAWVAWREGNHPESQANGLAALELWRPFQVVYPFHWSALWPLIGVALRQDRLTEAVDYARLLLDPQQQSLPDALNALLEATIRSWDAGQSEAARTHLRQATALAQDMGYL
jgi:DNA-binding SARP family transcriptional activator